MPALVDILLSTYNGAAHVEAQIASVLAQTEENLRLLVRDDGSRDGTVALVEAIAGRDPRVVLVDRNGPNLGAAGSFMALLRHIEAPCFMFCDQDDVWLPDKVAVSLAALEPDGDRPGLAFSDLRVVDGDLAELSPSFMRFQRFDPIRGTRLPRLLMQNVVVGCTLAGNRALLEASGLVDAARPRDVMMHDWWLTLVASAFGTITYLDRPTILYRQHGGNVLGAPGSNFGRYMRMLRNQRPWRKAQTYLSRVSRQAASFGQFYGDRLDPTQRMLVERVAGLREGHVQVGLLRAYAAGIGMNAVDRNVALFLSNSLGRMRECWQ